MICATHAGHRLHCDERVVHPIVQQGFTSFDSDLRPRFAQVSRLVDDARESAPGVFLRLREGLCGAQFRLRAFSRCCASVICSSRRFSDVVLAAEAASFAAMPVRRSSVSLRTATSRFACSTASVAVRRNESRSRMTVRNSSSNSLLLRWTMMRFLIPSSISSAFTYQTSQLAASKRVRPSASLRAFGFVCTYPRVAPCATPS